MSLQLETVPERQEQRRVSLIGLGAACAISAGAGMLLLMGAPFLVLAVLVGVAAAIAAVWTSIKNPYHGLMIYIFLEYSRMSEVVPAVARFYPARIIAVCALIGWVASTCRSRARIVWSGQTWLMTGLVMSMAISSITAIWASHAIQVTTDVAKTLVVFIIITNVIDSREKLRGMAWLLVSAGFVLGAYSSGIMLSWCSASCKRPLPRSSMRMSNTGPIGARHRRGSRAALRRSPPPSCVPRRGRGRGHLFGRFGAGLYRS